MKRAASPSTQPPTPTPRHAGIEQTTPEAERLSSKDVGKCSQAAVSTRNEISNNVPGEPVRAGDDARSAPGQALVQNLDALNIMRVPGTPRAPFVALAVTAASTFDCTRLHVRNMGGRACAKRWQARRRRKHDICCGCPEGEARASILQIEEPQRVRYGRSGYRAGATFNFPTQRQIARGVPAKGKS